LIAGCDGNTGDDPSGVACDPVRRLVCDSSTGQPSDPRNGVPVVSERLPVRASPGLVRIALKSSIPYLVKLIEYPARNTGSLLRIFVYHDGLRFGRHATPTEGARLFQSVV
jgi:hypothetical protein